MMKTALLVVSYAKDAEFFEHCANSYGRYVKGFDFAKVVVPFSDVELFRPLAERNGMEVEGFEETPGKGFLSHMGVKCKADLRFPEADLIFHLDSDSVFCTSSTPSDWIVNGNPLIAYVDFDRFLTSPIQPGEEANFMGWSGERSGLNRNQYFWKFASDFALGYPVSKETMAWMPIVHRRETYQKLREVVEQRHRVRFDEYLLSCRNEFPQTFCEFNALGGIADKFYHDRYAWRNVGTDGYPFVRVIQTWSHGGLDRLHEFAKEVGGLQTPRELFNRLEV